MLTAVLSNRVRYSSCDVYSCSCVLYSCTAVLVLVQLDVYQLPCTAVTYCRRTAVAVVLRL